ncbi:hypothetical protein D3C72_1641430 [compost metagenome]
MCPCRLDGCVRRRISLLVLPMACFCDVVEFFREWANADPSSKPARAARHRPFPQPGLDRGRKLGRARPWPRLWCGPDRSAPQPHPHAIVVGAPGSRPCAHGPRTLARPAGARASDPGRRRTFDRNDQRCAHALDLFRAVASACRAADGHGDHAACGQLGRCLGQRRERDHVRAAGTADHGSSAGGDRSSA